MELNLTQEQVQTLTAFADAMKMVAGGEKQAATHTGITLHGPGGIFSTFGLDRDVINAHLEPEGLCSVLPFEPSMDTDPRYASITGVTDSSGSQPTNTCEAAPTAFLKGCNLTARFGRIRFDTNTIEFDEVIQRYNRGDFMDLRLVGGLVSPNAAGAGLMPSISSGDDMLNVVTLAEMLVAGIQAQREIVRQTWQGNIFVNNEFPGLDSQIATGQMDADRPGVLCTALDSDVKTFGYSDVCGTDRDIVEYVSMMHWYLKFNARRMKLMPVKWVAVMRPELWYELSACWPCRYLTNRCQSAGGTEVSVINDEANVSLRDRMRDEMYLPVNGENIDVVVDDGIFEYNSTNNANLNPGEFASSLYFVPLTILGSFAATYREYLNYRSTVAGQNIALLNNRNDFWTDSGSFSWAYEGSYWCFLLGLKTEQRVILRTPQLAGKIQHIRYTPLQHLRSPYPDSPYWADGGVSIRPAPRDSYSVWASGLIPG